MAAESGGDAAPFMLIQPGPRVREEPTGGADLLDHFKLAKIYDHAVGLQPQNYLRGLAGGAELRRGRGSELAPLADVFAPSTKPDIQPLPRAALQAAFSLEPGQYQVPQGVMGEPVVTTMRPDASASLGGGGGGTAAGSSGGAVGEQRRKDRKKDKKGKKEKKEKKRKRDGSMGEAATQ